MRLSAITEFPRREIGFGEQGKEGDRLFEAQMARFRGSDFGDAHIQERSLKQKLGQVRYVLGVHVGCQQTRVSKHGL